MRGFKKVRTELVVCKCPLQNLKKVYAVKGITFKKRNKSAYGYDGYVRATTSHDSNWRITNIVSHHRYSGGNHEIDRNYIR